MLNVSIADAILFGFKPERGGPEQGVPEQVSIADAILFGFKRYFYVCMPVHRPSFNR